MKGVKVMAEFKIWDKVRVIKESDSFDGIGVMKNGLAKLRH